MKKPTTWLIIGLIMGLVIGGAAGYFISNNLHRFNFLGRGSLQIDDKTKNEITSFFESTSDINTINSYCAQNRMNCLYYCRNINPNHEICQNLMNYTGRGA